MSRVWHGNAELKRRLVPVSQLRTHPRNARRGDIAAIAASIERFGQQRAGLARTDGTIVAGNHSFLAARDRLGFTHWAVDHSDLDDDEADAYLVADNRTADLGTYDLPMLAALIEPFASNLDGLGFTPDEYEALVESAAGIPAVTKPEKPEADAVQTLFLPYPKAQHEAVTRWLTMIGREWGTDLSGTVYKLAKKAAEEL